MTASGFIALVGICAISAEPARRALVPQARNPFSYTNRYGYIAARPILDKGRAMAFLDSLVSPLASIIDKVIPDPKARDAAKLELLRLQGTQELDGIRTQLTAIVAEANSADPWTSRARPGFLYVMYVMILWSLPMGLVAAFRPEAATAIAAGITGYLNGLPEPLYALFGTGYLGYTAARQYGKAKGSDR
jgi:hypothetical protein